MSGILCLSKAKGMVTKMDIFQFWKDVLKQDANAIRGYFDKDAYINCHCTN